MRDAVIWGRRNLGASLLAVATVTSTLAALLQLDVLISVIALIVALAGIAQLILSAVIVPNRRRAALTASVPVQAMPVGHEPADGPGFYEGNAVQVSSNLWVTSARLLPPHHAPWLRLLDTDSTDASGSEALWTAAQVRYRSERLALAVLECPHPGRPLARPAGRTVAARLGDIVQVCGWSHGVHDRVRLVHLSTAQGTSHDGQLMITGSESRLGLDGAAAIDQATGLLLGVVVAFEGSVAAGRRQGSELYVALLSSLDKELRRELSRKGSAGAARGA